MGTYVEQAEDRREWYPIDTLPDGEGPFRFRWADGEEREMDGYEPERWSEDGHREEHPFAWAPA